MFTKDRNCIFTAQFDPSTDKWNAIQVFRDGNAVTLSRGFAARDEAEEEAADWGEAYEAWRDAKRREAAIELKMNRQED